METKLYEIMKTNEFHMYMFNVCTFEEYNKIIIFWFEACANKKLNSLLGAQEGIVEGDECMFVIRGERIQ